MKGESKPRRLRIQSRRIFVATEGKVTEPGYIQGLCAHFRLTDTHATVKAMGVGADPLKVVQACLRKREEHEARGNSFDDYFCLIDVDEHTTLQEALTLAERQGVKVVVSNPKFEVWLRWHCDSKRGAMSSKELDRFVTEHGLLRQKTIPRDFPYDRTTDATRAARAADPKLSVGRKGRNPSTALPVLLDTLSLPQASN